MTLVGHTVAFRTLLQTLIGDNKLEVVTTKSNETFKPNATT